MPSPNTSNTARMIFLMMPTPVLSVGFAKRLMLRVFLDAANVGVPSKPVNAGRAEEKTPPARRFRDARHPQRHERETGAWLLWCWRC